jgi:3-oxoacyl-[acyl-carrier protein] reductase
MSKTVIITGASGGIGSAATILFAEKGWNVVMNYYRSGEAAKLLASSLASRGYSVFPIYADVSDRSHVERMIYEAERRYGKIDALVNNAGISQQKLFTDITDSDFQKMFDVNLKGPFLCSQCVLPVMIHQKSGKIVNVSSVWGVTGASCEVHYSASKAAVIGMTKALAREVAPSGITVNCIAPGVIDTSMNKGFDEETINSLKEETPVGRLGTPDEVAKAILFFANNDSGFITGQVLGIDGGFI